MYVPDTISDEELARMLEQGPNVIGPGPYALAREVRQLRDAARLTSSPDAKVALVNEFKADEERLLRKLDALTVRPGTADSNVNTITAAGPIDQRWLAIGRTQLQEAFMSINRSVFQPQRIKLPEDE